jgi:hypothetical protein
MKGDSASGFAIDIEPERLHGSGRSGLSACEKEDERTSFLTSVSSILRPQNEMGMIWNSTVN